MPISSGPVTVSGYRQLVEQPDIGVCGELPVESRVPYRAAIGLADSSWSSQSPRMPASLHLELPLAAKGSFVGKRAGCELYFVEAGSKFCAVQNCTIGEHEDGG